MTGVSYMIPFVAAGGILIALGFLFGGDEVVYKLYGGTYEGVDLREHCRQPAAGFPKGGFDTMLPQAGFAGLLFVLGKIAFFMLVPILSGFIAFAIADRPGLVPGIVGGLLAAARRRRLPRRPGLRLRGRWSGLLHDPAQGAEGCSRHHAGGRHPAGLHHPRSASS